MQEYSTNYFQITTLIEMIENGWTVNDIAEYQGYMNIHLVKENNNHEEGYDDWNFDMEIIK